MGQFGYNAEDDPRFQLAFYNIDPTAGANRLQSYVRGCAFDRGFNAGIGAQFNTHGLEITNNIIFGAPEDGIRILSDDCKVHGNVVGNIFERSIWKDLGIGGGNNDFDAGGVPAGIDFKDANTIDLKDNIIIGIDGPCFHGTGEQCNGLQEACNGNLIPRNDEKFSITCFLTTFSILIQNFFYTLFFQYKFV